MIETIGVSELKDIVISLHGADCKPSKQVYYEVLDELQNRLPQDKYKEFVESL